MVGIRSDMAPASKVEEVNYVVGLLLFGTFTFIMYLFCFTFSCSSMVHEFITANKKYFFSGNTSLEFIQTGCFWVLRLFKPRTVNA